MDYEIFPSFSGVDAEYLVLSSGLGGHGKFWQPQIGFFQQFYHVVIYDQEGCHADSALLSKDYCMQDLAKQLLKILQSADIDRFHFIGHALGGFIGAELARLIYDDSALTMLSCTVLNGWANLDPHTKKCFQTRINILKHAGTRAYVEAQALFLYPPAWISQNINSLRSQEDVQIENFQPTYNVLSRLNALMNYQLSQETKTALDHIPLHLIANQDDFLVPYQQSVQLSQLFPHAVLKILNTGAHAATVTESDRMNQVMFAFLQDSIQIGA